MSIMELGQREEHVSAMEGEEIQQPPAMPVLPRLDRLDYLLNYLEEKQDLSKRSSTGSFRTKAESDKQCKPLSSVLEEVHFKGTLMERVAMLENRVLQLSLEVEERSTSSSSTIPVSENTVHDLPGKNNEELNNTLDEKENQNKIQEKASQEVWACKPPAYKKSSKHRTLPVMRYRKWLGWIQMGC
ncbi:uncharacterized protein LOC143861102 [Tasmannia lanceolata]|uniref:uncharacterized protein LOC143861102 n=1 Tax=Tasmannia lanceolata TaxID=3420 RepID=UPI00406427EE